MQNDSHIDSIIQKLEDFRDRLVNHRTLISDEREKGIGLRDHGLVQIEGEKLLEDAGILRPIVQALVGVRSLRNTGAGELYPWLEAFSSFGNRWLYSSLDIVIRDVIEAIGYLKGAETRKALPLLLDRRSERLKVLISHDGDSDIRTKLELELFRNSLDPIVVEAQTLSNESVDEAVSRFLEESSFAVVIARVEVSALQDGAHIPRGSMIDEIARIRSQLGDKFIVLLEEGITLPTTLATGIIYKQFTEDKFDRALLDVFKALRDHQVI